MTYQRRLTAGDTVYRMMSAVGLTPTATPSTSVDTNVQQIWTLVSDVGQELLAEHDWQFAQGEHTITTDGSLTYALPSDFDRYIPDSQWNRTSKLPMLGSLSTKEWQAITARSLGGTTVALLFQVEDDMVELYSEPADPQTLVLPYVSRSWATDTTGVTSKDNVDADDDIILYESTLFRAALLLSWRTTRGFDTTAAQRKFDDALSAAKAKDAPARTLSVVPGGRTPLLGALNIPETTYGT